MRPQTFLFLFFSMLSTAKTCSPAAGSSMFDEGTAFFYSVGSICQPPRFFSYPLKNPTCNGPFGVCLSLSVTRVGAGWLSVAVWGGLHTSGAAEAAAENTSCKWPSAWRQSGRRFRDAGGQPVSPLLMSMKNVSSEIMGKTVSKDKDADPRSFDGPCKKIIIIEL